MQKKSLLHCPELYQKEEVRSKMLPTVRAPGSVETADGFQGKSAPQDLIKNSNRCN